MASDEQKIKSLRNTLNQLRERLNANDRARNEITSDLIKADRELKELEEPRDRRLNVVLTDKTLVFFEKKYGTGAYQKYSYVAMFIGGFWYITQNGANPYSLIPRKTHQELVEFAGPDTTLYFSTVAQAFGSDLRPGLHR